MSNVAGPSGDGQILTEYLTILKCRLNTILTWIRNAKTARVQLNKKGNALLNPALYTFKDAG